jgi:ABC-2 type transport system ATP-binding protein
VHPPHGIGVGRLHGTNHDLGHVEECKERAGFQAAELRTLGPVPAIDVRGLVVRYGDLVAVDGLSFAAEAGTVTVLLGPNGAGKTSTIEVLEGYRRAGAGTVRVAGLDPVTEHRDMVSRIGVMLQRGGVHPNLRAGEAAELFAALYGRRHQAAELLALVGLTERTRSTWRQLSGGEQQRLSLALAIAGDPEVAFLDEPTASVDPAGRVVVRAVVRRLAEQGACVLLTTHELDEAERLADRVIIIDHGRLVGEGTPAELRDAGGVAEIRFGAPARLDVAGLAARLGAAVREASEGEYVVEAAPEPATIAALTAWLAEHSLPLADLRAGRQRLEDVFLRLTGDGSR